MSLALVTGAARGLGLEVVRQLRQRGLDVVLTARDPERGRAAAHALGAEFLRLDVADPASVAHAAAALRAAHPEGLDVLVCNAGVFGRLPVGHVAEDTLAVNFHGAHDVTCALLPQLRPDARVVLVSSGLGDRGTLSPALRAEVSAPGLSREQLVAFMRRFVAAVKAGTRAAEGWPGSPYDVSKIGVNALARVLARDLASDPRRIKINAVCPGWVRTDMGGPDAERDVDEGAAGVVWAAMLGPAGPSGGFYRDGAAADW